MIYIVENEKCSMIKVLKYYYEFHYSLHLAFLHPSLCPGSFCQRTQIYKYASQY